MKNLMAFRVTAIVLMCCMILSCSKKDDFITNTTDTPLLKSSAVFEVSPSGNYDDDAYNIQTALNDAVEAGVGSIVKLTAGTFYLKNRLEIDGFDGYFIGSGRQNTIITTHDPVDFNLPNDDCEALIKFRHGNVRMSDLTIQITLADPCTGLFNNDWWENAFPIVIMITGNSTAIPTTTDQTAKASFDKVNFIGGAGNMFDKYNVGHFFWAGGDGWTPDYALTNGNYKFTNCSFKTAAVCITNNPQINESWIIGGSASSGNTFEDAGYGVGVGEFSNTFAEISHNTFTKMYWAAVLISQGYFWDATKLSLSTFLVQNNDIEVQDYADAIGVVDLSYSFGDVKKMDATISNNKMSLNTYWGGVWGWGGKDIIVTNNIITGYGIAGIYNNAYYNNDGGRSSNWLIKGNNLSNLNAWGAKIWLDPGTSNYTVIGGGPNAINVYNEGTNNILTGVNNMQGNSPGPAIKEAMARKLETMKTFKDLRKSK